MNFRRIGFSNKQIAFLLTLCLGCSTSVFAQEPLEVYLKMARKNAIVLKQSKVSREDAKLKADEAFWSLFPVIGLSGNYRYNQYESSIDERIANPNQDPENPNDDFLTTNRVLIPRRQGSLGARITVNLFDLPAIYRYRGERENIKTADVNIDLQKQAVELSVAKAYYEYVTALKVSAISKQIKLNLQNQKQAIQVRYELGVINIQDIYSIDIRIQQEEDRAIRASQFLRQACRNLERISEVPCLKTDSLSDNGKDVDLSEPKTLDYWIAQIGGLPSVTMAKSQVRGARTQTKRAWAELAPVLGVSAQQDFYSYDTFNGRNKEWQVGANLTWRFDFAMPSRIKKAKNAERGARLQLVQSEKQARSSIEDAYDQVITLLKRVKNSKKLVEISRNHVKQQLAQYEAVQINIQTLIQANDQLLAAEIENARLEEDLELSRIILTLSAGQRI